MDDGPISGGASGARPKVVVGALPDMAPSMQNRSSTGGAYVPGNAQLPPTALLGRIPVSFDDDDPLGGGHPMQ